MKKRATATTNPTLSRRDGGLVGSEKGKRTTRDREGVRSRWGMTGEEYRKKNNIRIRTYVCYAICKTRGGRCRCRKNYHHKGCGGGGCGKGGQGSCRDRRIRGMLGGGVQFNYTPLAHLVFSSSRPSSPCRHGDERERNPPPRQSVGLRVVMKEWRGWRPTL